MTLTKWHKTLRERGCVICDSTESLELHHCHGGSMNDVLAPHQRPGMGQKVSDWLVIPLHKALHTGDLGIDTGMGRFRSVVEWEAEFGTQVAFLDRLVEEYGVDVWSNAGVER